MLLTIVIPVYNEGDRLEASVHKITAYLKKHFDLYEIIIVEDGSMDGSLDAARRLAARDSNINVLHNDSRRGRGASLATALKEARGDYVIYMDADLATGLEHTASLVKGLEEGASVTTGSRLMKGSRASRPLTRQIASRAYNSLVRLLFKSTICDHQCGFKGFNKTDVLGLIDLILDNHWLWDTELLIICQKVGLKINEFPIAWVHNGGNSLNASKVKVFRDSFTMGMKLLKLKYRLAMFDIVSFSSSPQKEKSTYG